MDKGAEMTQQFIEVYPYKDNYSLSLLNISFIKLLHVKRMNLNIFHLKPQPESTDKWFVLAELKGGEIAALIPCHETEHDAVSEALNIFPLLNIEDA